MGNRELIARRLRKATLALAASVCCLLAHSTYADDAPAQTEAQVPGDVRIARWDVILNETGFESIDGVDNQIQHTTSKGYDGAIYNADALRAGINAAAGVNGFEGGSQSMAFTQNYGDNQIQMQQSLYFNYFQSRNRRIGVQGNANGTETYAKVDDTHLKITLDYPNMNMELMVYEPNRGTTQTKLDQATSISFDGQLQPGDALAFSAPIKDKTGANYRHVIIWEAFKAEQRYQQNFEIMRDSEKWCQIGPKWIRHYADVAAVWSHNAKHDSTTVPAKWEQKMEDGKILRLTGVTRTDKYLYCWWDADGQPIRNDGGWFSIQAYYKDQPVWFSAELTGTESEWKKETPTGKPSRFRGQQSGSFTDRITTPADNKGQAIVGVPVGDWEMIGEIKKGGKIKVGTATYTLRNVQALGNNEMYCNFYPDRYGANQSDVVALTVLKNDGTEVDTSYSRVLTAANYGTPTPQFEGVSAKDIKTFHVWKRKQVWIPFTGFATEPITQPKDPVTAAEVTAAVASQPNVQSSQRGVSQGMMMTPEERKKWEAIPADPSTAKGALRAMFQSAAAGDVDAVRARMKTTQSDATVFLNTMAKFITSSQVARKTAIARYGPEKVQTIAMLGAGQMAPPPMMDLEAMFATRFEDQPDGTAKLDQTSITKNADGKYALDLTQVAEEASGLKGAAMIMVVAGLSQRLDHINELMKDPKFSFDDLHKALADPTSFPATMPAATPAAATKPAG